MLKMNTGIRPKALRDVIDNAMLKLDKEDYDILYELYFEHTSVHQLGRSLGITCKAIRWRRNKALKQLKKIILKEKAKYTSYSLNLRRK